MEINEPAGGQMFGEPDLMPLGKYIDERSALAQRMSEAPRGNVETRYLDAIDAAFYQQTDRAARKIDCRKGRIIAAKHAMPDHIDRVVGAQETNRRMRHERDASLIFNRKGLKPRQVERFHIQRMDGAVDRPFKARNIGEIFERRGWLKTA